MLTNLVVTYGTHFITRASFGKFNHTSSIGIVNGALIGGVLGTLIVITMIVAAVVLVFIFLFQKGTSVHV